MEYLTLSNFGEGTFWFALLGASAAAVKHFVNPGDAFAQLTPVALKQKAGVKDEIHPAAMWWGSYAFSIMNAGFAAQGMYAAAKGNAEGKDAFVLSTGILFALFSLAWITKGQMTQIANHKKQATKIGMFSALFFAGFAARTMKA